MQPGPVKTPKVLRAWPGMVTLLCWLQAARGDADQRLQPEGALQGGAHLADKLRLLHQRGRVLADVVNHAHGG